ncbi:guanyl-nucleotide exchange factor, putative [Entamoeba invadens IP1]|uniref:Guanyl-nucleotide exchange factor, putative n=1 Tax=Entamoeba invadens IP1 TaxID=370355 RepID=A0A0A1UH19_ENTIV|nr:guanyl-nucleotide exchange factor, putative [Entamoeba invadens IP1]ELP94425.1 guanyl-nucleotide exchange factor, putative [Entamoeba invadens IP1]|eukprot:XP_004261196.1 guanyl-nucleotide exchange factor, putative [Entamoeba invadens IP1]
MNDFDSIVQLIFSSAKKVRSLRAQYDELRQMTLASNFKQALNNGSNKEFFEKVFVLLKDCPVKETAIIKGLVDLIEYSYCRCFIPQHMYTTAVETVLESYKYSPNLTVNNSFINCLRQSTLSPIHPTHDDLLLKSFQVLFDASLMTNIHTTTLSNCVDDIAEIIKGLLINTEIATMRSSEEETRPSGHSRNSSTSPVTPISPVFSDVSKSFADSFEILDFLYTLTTTRWSQREIGSQSFKYFIQTMTNEAKEMIDLKCKIQAIRFLTVWISNFSNEIKKSDMFLKSERQRVVVQKITNTAIYSLTEELLFTEGISLIKAVLDHPDLFKGLLNELFYVVFVSVLRHPNTTQSMKLKTLEVFNKVTEKRMLPQLYINCDCELYGENDVWNIFNILLYVSENESDELVKKAALSTLQILINSLKQDVVEPTHGEIDIEELIQHKTRFVEICKIFKEDAKKGMRLFFDEKFCEETPEGVVAFYTNHIDLDKVAIGDYVGKPDPFNVSVLTALIASLNFKGKEIDEALRLVFEAFVMGGESQVVDRVMESFGKFYYEENKERLVALNLTSDNVYQFATSVIFLSTESHNPSAKTKAMDTYEKFKDVITSGFGITLDDGMLKGVFERTTKEAFYFPDISIVDKIQAMDKIDMQGKKRFAVVQQDLRKLNAYARQKAVLSNFTPFIPVAPQCVPLKIYDLVIQNVSKTISKIFEEVQSMENIKMLLKTVVDLIHISCITVHPTKSSLIDILIQMMRMNEVEKITPRNMVAVQTMLMVCGVECNNLEECWERCLSSLLRVERIHMIASGWKDDVPPKMSKDERISKFSVYKSSYKQDGDKEEITAEKIPSCVLDVGDSDLINLYNTLELTDEAVVYFFKGICGVAIKELEAPIPRINILQRIVICLNANITRPEMVWHNILKHLVPFYIRCGLHPVENVAMSVIDNLRQLTMEIMTKKECDLPIQNELFKSYVVVVSDHPSPQVRDFVIQVLHQIFTNKKYYENMKSGWESLFEIFLFASVDCPSVSINSFQFFKNVFKVFEKSSEYETFYFDFLRCLKSFGSLKSVEEVELQVLTLTQVVITNRLGTNKEITLNDQFYEQLLPLFELLGRNIHSTYVSVSTSAVDIFFTLIREFIPVFTPDLTEVILKTCILRLFTIDVPQSWVTNSAENLFHKTLEFLLENATFVFLLEKILDFAMYVIYNEGNNFTSAALSFINRFISGVCEKGEEKMLEVFINKFALFCDCIVQFVPNFEKFQSTLQTPQKSPSVPRVEVKTSDKAVDLPAKVINGTCSVRDIAVKSVIWKTLKNTGRHVLRVSICSNCQKKTI